MLREPAKAKPFAGIPRRPGEGKIVRDKDGCSMVIYYDQAAVDHVARRIPWLSRVAGRAGKESDVSGEILRPYIPASWFHSKGIFKVLARLNPKLPDVEGMLFLTFTLDPALFANASLGFDRGRDRLRRVFYRLRRGVVWEGKRHVIDEPYCVKLEFHANGWAHFHVIFLTRRFLPGALLNELWGLGRTNVKRITNDKFRYLLKYVTKADTLPGWALSRRRLRVFQSSRGFYTQPAEPKPEVETRTGVRRRVRTLGERIERWKRTALLQNGERHEQVFLGAPFGELLALLIFPVAQAGRYLGGGHILINDRTELFEWINPTQQTQPDL